MSSYSDFLFPSGNYIFVFDSYFVLKLDVKRPLKKSEALANDARKVDKKVVYPSASFRAGATATLK